MDYKYAFYPTLLDSYFRYKRSEDELSFIQLFDKINKVEQELDEERLKGIAFEGLINELINANKTKQHDILKLDNEIYKVDDFEFEGHIVNKIADKLLRCSAIQSYKEKIIDTTKGKVRIYGVFDYEFPQMMADLKTTKSYSYGKYENNMQHKFTALATDLKEFNYIATDFEYMFTENHWLTDKVRKQGIDDIVEFIEFIEYFKKYITNRKLFGCNN